MSIKIIVSDLDGTLMSPDHITVTQRTEKALESAYNKGIKIAIATGRTLSLAWDAAERVEFADYIICSNGASVYNRKSRKFIYENLVSPQTTAKSIEFLDSLPVFYNIYMDGNIYVQKGSEKFFKNDGFPEDFLEEFVSKIILCDDIAATTAGKGAELIDVFYTEPEIKKTVFDFLNSENLVLTSALKGVVSATAVGADKGTALKGLCDSFNIKPNEVMAFGDASNDATMLQFAHYSFAMENGDEICKKSARYAAPSNANDGVAQMIEKYAL